MYLFTASRSTLWDRDEPRFALATLEMQRSGNWLYPTLHGQVRAQKPILVYWLMLLSFGVFGPTELAARFWSAAAAAAACLLAFGIARRLTSERAGLWTMAALASTPLLMIEGTAATADALLLAGVTAVMAVYAAALARGMTAGLVLALAAGLAVALYAKGPIGLVVPLVAMGGAAILLPGTHALSRRDRVLIASGVLLGMLLFTAWFLPADRSTGGQFLREGLGREVVRRAAQPMEGHGGKLLTSFPYYVPVLFIGFSPWTLYLPGAVSATLGGRVGGKRGRALLAGWFGGNFLLFSIVATKLPHYVLPLWPALALSVGGTLAAEREGRLSERDRIWLARGIWLFAPLVAVETIALLAGVWFLPEAAPLRLPAALVGVGLAAMGGVVLRHHLAGRFQTGALLLAVCVPLLLVLGAVLVLPALERYKPVPAIAGAIRRRAPGTSVWTYVFDSPSLDFYLQPVPVVAIEGPGAFAAWRSQRRPGVLVLPRSSFDRLVPPSDRRDFVEIAAASGLEYDKGHWVDLVAEGHCLPGLPKP